MHKEKVWNKAGYVIGPDGKSYMPTLEERFWLRVIKLSPSECWGWIGCKDRDGYGMMKAGGRMMRANRFSYELHIGPIPAGLGVLHSCDNPECCNPAHLSPGTSKDNVRQCIERGRRNHDSITGEKQWQSKLTVKSVKYIRKTVAMARERVPNFTWARTGLIRDLALKFNISESNISAVANNNAWRHVTV